MENQKSNGQVSMSQEEGGNLQRIKAPEGIVKLVGDLWLRHKPGVKQSQNNVFWIDFPPLTEEELAEIEAEKKAESDAVKIIEKITSDDSQNGLEDEQEDL